MRIIETYLIFQENTRNHFDKYQDQMESLCGEMNFIYTTTDIIKQDNKDLHDTIKRI